MRRIGNTPILKENEIKRVFENPKRISSDSFILLYKDGKEKKVAFTVKKGNYRTIVERNRMKRILRKLFVENESEFDKNLNYVFIANRKILTKDIEKLKEEFSDIVKKVKEV
ncbi:MAG: ribonuclease P protein component [bacterium]|uniref:Ribonuclease P protein component n=2 Tax=Bacteria candidate phyla TaxID=1783234 RepID=A0A101I1L7_UNCT6|nr:MAG: Ribonuclease P protein component [candidate division TA06 bacterium 32_111]KUK87063.1 MAG: Ribonuclease P protein component [candidate division TA06 bacterium 34_109]MDI6699658.1 ribonuclease P protein component [bacterium]HAF07647.1 ribonuclease P protein component [candidate division WOR-3 bacterium]HCP17435.1 ribonuclease P protein component [candidate division WOR-3 bacterium]